MYAGPRGLLFKQILPGAEPLLDLMQKIAEERSRSVSQVLPSSSAPCCTHLPLTVFSLPAARLHGRPDAELMLAGGHQLVHVSRHNPDTWSQVHEPSQGQLCCHGVAPV